MPRRFTFLSLAVLSLAAAPQDARKWAQALAYFQKFSGSREPLERARAVEDLGNSTSEKFDKTCWPLVGQLLRRELGPEGKPEEQVSGDVVESCLGALRKITHKDVLADMLKSARARNETLRFRTYALWGLGARAEPRDLLDFVDDPKLPALQVAALDAIAERADPSSADLFLRVLREPERPWEAKLAALQGLWKIAEEKHVEPLIEALGNCRPDEGRLKDRYLKILGKLVGADLPTDDPNAWRAAWAAKKAGGEPGKLGADTVAESTEFYGLKTRSTRIVFLLDHTGSMKAPGNELPRAPRPPPDAAGGPRETAAEAQAREEASRIRKAWDDKRIATRLDAAKKEFLNTVYVLHPRVRFNVIWYESNARPWKPDLVPASWPHKLDCMREAEKLSPAGMTNIWDALETAYRMTETPQKPGVIQIDRKANYATALNGADTFFLMTDGRPSAGRLSSGLEILAEIRKVNRLRRVALHAICVGDESAAAGVPGVDPPDPEFMKRLAEENGGEFVHIR